MDFLTNPFIVILLFLYQLLGGSLVLAIIVFTVLSRLLTWPLTQAQLRSSKRMQELTPKLQALREKYKGDREKMAQAQMELYRENGVNPLAGCLPLLIQLPILFGLYGAIYAGLGTAPLQLADVNNRLLVPSLSSMLPLNNQFLWLNLGLPDPYLILPVLVVATTWLQSKLMTPMPTDPKDPTASTARTMTVMMPLLIGLFSLSFASGLSIYWVASNLVGIGQYAMMGKIDWGNVFGRPKAKTVTRSATPGFVPEPAVAAEPAESSAPKPKIKKGLADPRTRTGSLPAGSTTSNGGASANASRADAKPTNSSAPVRTEGISRKTKSGSTAARKAKPSKAK